MENVAAGDLSPALLLVTACTITVHISLDWNIRQCNYREAWSLGRYDNMVSQGMTINVNGSIREFRCYMHEGFNRIKRRQWLDGW